MVAEHLIAHTRGGARGLLDHAQASWLWARLRAGFPEAFSLVLMPDHMHLVAPPGGHARFVRVLAMFAARFGVRFDVIVERANTAEIAMRMMRYGFHNPVRDGLVGDPYAWRWSTLRDLVGAAHPIWTHGPRIARVLGVKEGQLVQRVTHIGDLRPRRPELVPPAAVGLSALRDATAAALRMDDVGLTTNVLARQLVVQAAYDVGIPDAAQLSAAVGSSRRTIRRVRAQRHPALPAVLLCLGDPRLRHAAAPRR